MTNNYKAKCEFCYNDGVFNGYVKLRLTNELKGLENKKSLNADESTRKKFIEQQLSKLP